MKKKIKTVTAVVTLTIFSLIISHRQEPQSSPSPRRSPHTQWADPVAVTAVDVDKDSATPPQDKSVVSDESPETSP